MKMLIDKLKKGQKVYYVCDYDPLRPQLFELTITKVGEDRLCVKPFTLPNGNTHKTIIPSSVHRTEAEAWEALERKIQREEDRAIVGGWHWFEKDSLDKRKQIAKSYHTQAIKKELADKPQKRVYWLISELNENGIGTHESLDSGLVLKEMGGCYNIVKDNGEELTMMKRDCYTNEDIANEIEFARGERKMWEI